MPFRFQALQEGHLFRRKKLNGLFESVFFCVSFADTKEHTLKNPYPELVLIIELDRRYRLNFLRR